MKGTVKHTMPGMVALADPEGGLIAVKTDRKLEIGDEVEFKQLVHVGATDKGTPLFENREIEINGDTYNKDAFSNSELCLAALKMLLVNTLDKELDEVEFLIMQLAAQTRDNS